MSSTLTYYVLGELLCSSEYGSIYSAYTYEKYCHLALNPLSTSGNPQSRVTVLDSKIKSYFQPSKQLYEPVQATGTTSGSVKSAAKSSTSSCEGALKRICIKEIHWSKMTASQRQSALNEAVIMTAYHHPCSVGIYAAGFGLTPCEHRQADMELLRKEVLREHGGVGMIQTDEFGEQKAAFDRCIAVKPMDLTQLSAEAISDLANGSGNTPAGSFFIAMEYCAAGDLAECVRARASLVLQHSSPNHAEEDGPASHTGEPELDEDEPEDEAPEETVNLSDHSSPQLSDSARERLARRRQKQAMLSVEPEVLKQYGLPEPLIIRWVLQICLALDELHSATPPVLHRDLKVSNVFVMNSACQRVKLGDFGIAKQSDASALAKTMVGTPYYLSPEICRGRAYGTASDVWGLGCLIYELCALRPPFEGDSLAGVVRGIVRGQRAVLPKGVYSAELEQLIDSLLAPQAHMRPSVREILHHRLLRQSFDDLLATAVVLPAAELEAQQQATTLNPMDLSLADVVYFSEAELEALRMQHKQLYGSTVLRPSSTVPTRVADPAPVTPNAKLAQLDADVNSIFEAWNELRARPVDREKHDNACDDPNSERSDEDVGPQHELTNGTDKLESSVPEIPSLLQNPPLETQSDPPASATGLPSAVISTPVPPPRPPKPDLSRLASPTTPGPTSLLKTPSHPSSHVHVDTLFESVFDAAMAAAKEDSPNHYLQSQVASSGAAESNAGMSKTKTRPAPPPPLAPVSQQSVREDHGQPPAVPTKPQLNSPPHTSSGVNNGVNPASCSSGTAVATPTPSGRSKGVVISPTPSAVQNPVASITQTPATASRARWGAKGIVLQALEPSAASNMQPLPSPSSADPASIAARRRSLANKVRQLNAEQAEESGPRLTTPHGTPAHVSSPKAAWFGLSSNPPPVPQRGRGPLRQQIASSAADENMVPSSSAPQELPQTPGHPTKSSHNQPALHALSECAHSESTRSGAKFSHRKVGSVFSSPDALRAAMERAKGGQI